MTVVTKWKNSNDATPADTPVPVPQGVPVATPGGAGEAGEVDPRTLPILQAFPSWTTGQNVSMHVYFSTSPIGDVFGVTNRKNWGVADSNPTTDSGVFPHWVWEDIPFGDWGVEKRVDTSIEVPWVCYLSTILSFMIIHD